MYLPFPAYWRCRSRDQSTEVSVEDWKLSLGPLGTVKRIKIGNRRINLKILILAIVYVWQKRDFEGLKKVRKIPVEKIFCSTFENIVTREEIVPATMFSKLSNLKILISFSRVNIQHFSKCRLLQDCCMGERVK